jgi:hypothetical protein
MSGGERENKAEIKAQKRSGRYHFVLVTTAPIIAFEKGTALRNILNPRQLKRIFNFTPQNSGRQILSQALRTIHQIEPAST